MSTYSFIYILNEYTEPLRKHGDGKIWEEKLYFTAFACEGVPRNSLSNTLSQNYCVLPETLCYSYSVVVPPTL